MEKKRKEKRNGPKNESANDLKLRGEISSK